MRQANDMLLAVAEDWVQTIPNARTRRSYRRAAEVLFESMAPLEPFPRPITSADLQTFKALLVEDYKPATVNQRLVAVSSFVRWLVSEGRLPDAILDDLPKRVSLKHQMSHAETTPKQAIRLCHVLRSPSRPQLCGHWAGLGNRLHSGPTHSAPV